MLVAPVSSMTRPASLSAPRMAGAAAAPAIRDALSEADRLIDETGATSLAPLVLLDRAALARLEGDTAARQRLLEEAKALFAGLGAPMRVRQIDALLAE